MSYAIPSSLPVERPVPLWVDGELIATFYCTPADLPELALGYLMGRGLLNPVRLPRVRVAENPLRVAAETICPAGRPAPRQEADPPWATTLAEVARRDGGAGGHRPSQRG